MSTKAPMVQYHALGLLYQIKQKDRLAVTKLVINQMQSATGRSPYTCILLIRFACKVLLRIDWTSVKLFMLILCIR